MSEHVIAKCPYCSWIWVPKSQRNGHIEPNRVPNKCPHCKLSYLIEGMPHGAGKSLRSINLDVRHFEYADTLQQYLSEKNRETRDRMWE